MSDQNIVELQQMYPASQDEVERYIKEQQPDGSWKDINYQDRKHSGWNAQVHANRILLLSKYYSSKKAELTAEQKQDLSNTIHGAMNFWFAKSRYA